MIAAAAYGHAGRRLERSHGRSSSSASPPSPIRPSTSKDASGKWVGWEIDLMNAVCAQMNEKCELVEVAWDGIIPALTSKQIDVIWSSMSITEERKKTDRLLQHVLQHAVDIIGPKDGDTRHHARAPEGQDDRRAGLDHPRAIRCRSTLLPAGAEVKTYSTQDEANNDLAAGRLDYVQADAPRTRRLPQDRTRACLLRTEGHRCRTIRRSWASASAPVSARKTRP